MAAHVQSVISKYLPALGWAVFAACVITLFTQVPLRREFDIGRNDAGIVQGFSDPEPIPATAQADAGVGRRVLPTAALRIPQAGTPVAVTMRWLAPAGMPVVIAINDQPPIQLIAQGQWEEHNVAVSSGWRKAIDLVIQITTPESPEQILLDRVVVTVTPPVWPYPAQVCYALMVGALCGLLLNGRPRWQPALAVGAYGLVWWLFYRSSPYPLLYLPPIVVAGLLAIWLIWRWPSLVVRWPRWATPGLVGVMMILWMSALLPAMTAHVTLARPGVENDFRVFATRDTLETIFQADGFYNLGYPLLLWLVRPLTHDNPFLAARLISLLAGAILIVGGYLLARSLLSPGLAILAAGCLALSGIVVQYGLLVGSDMPFAALMTLAVAVTLHVHRRSHARLALIGGVCAGTAFLVRHPGLLLLPWGAVTLWYVAGRRPALLFGLGFVLAAAPQLVVNTLQTGQPLFNQQAKNIWLAVYANTDWGRWDEVPNSIGLFEVIGRDPLRFLTNWSRNVVGFIGAGAEDVSEFGRADQLRLLGWPANWLAIGGLVAAGWLAWQHRADRRWLALLALIVLYVAAIATAFILPRFFLPLTPLYAVAAAWAIAQLWTDQRHLLTVALIVVVLLSPGPMTATQAVLAAQPADEVAAVALVQRSLPADSSRLVAAIPDRLPLAKYSAIAHLVHVRVSPTVTATELQALDAAYLLWDNAQGPPPIPEPERRRIGDGRFTLYSITALGTE